MREKISIINRFEFSLSPKKYVYLVKDNILKAFIYLLILASIVGLIQGFTAITILSSVEKSTEIAFKDENFKFEMKGGILNFDDSPYKEEQGQVLLLVDTNKNIDEVDSLRNITVHKELSTVFLKDGFMVKNGTNEMIYKYSDLQLDKFDFDNNTIINIVSKISMLKYIMIPVCIILKFIEMLLYILLISLAGLLSVVLNRQTLKYKEIFKLSIYSITLPSLISLIYPLGKYTIIVGGFMLILALNRVIREEQKEN